MSDKADIKELAVAVWRLEKWLDNLNADRKMAAKSALRTIKKYINASDVEVSDPIGAKFDLGLAVEVVNNEAEDIYEEELIIIETLAPYVYQNGELVQHARVIIGNKVKEEKPNKGIVEPLVENTEATKDSDVSNNTEEPNETYDIDDNEVEQPKKISSDINETSEDDIKIGAEDIERIRAYAKIL